MSLINDRVNTVIVGGGPAGLALAVQTQILNPDAKIAICERHQKYQRDHNLQLEKSSFDNFPQDERIQKIIQDFFKVEVTGFGTWLQSAFGPFFPALLPTTAHIRTVKIEETFKKLALELGIEFCYETIDCPKDLVKRFPNVKVIVGTDGSHSEVRKQLFTEVKFITEQEINALLLLLQKQDDSITFEELQTIAKEEGIQIRPDDTEASVDAVYESLCERHHDLSVRELLPILLKRLSHEELPYQEDLQYLAELKYEVEGDTTYSDSLLEAYPTQKLLNTIVQEYIGQPIDGMTPITLSAFIDKHTFEVLNGKATFKKPLTLNDPLIPQGLKKVFETWLKLREQQISYSLSSKLVEREKPSNRYNFKVTVTRLQSYRSAQFAKKIDNVMWALGGDAAAGVPFRKNYNKIGLPGTSKLAHTIAQSLRNPEEETEFFNSYATFIENIIHQQFSAADSKNSLIESSMWWLNTSAQSPIQIIKPDMDRLR